MTLKTGVLVIGGGITGAGILWDLALRGIDAVLIEQKEPAYGATGRCHGLLHGGCRYLVKDSAVAAECYRENKILQSVAKGAIENTGGYFVQVKGDDPGYVEQWLNLAGKTGIPVKEIDIQTAIKEEPLLAVQNIERVFTVPDAAVDPFDLTLMNLTGATQRGAKVFTNTRVEELIITGNQIRGAVVKDLASGESYSIHADIVVNAAGAWAASIAAKAGIRLNMKYGKGTLVVFAQRLTKRVINRLRKPGDGDIIVPAKSVCLLGTTDIPVSSPDDLDPTAAEITKMLNIGEEMFDHLSEKRILRTFAGIRPLYTGDNNNGEQNREISRGFAVINHERDSVDGFYSIVGGKLTTYRLMAEQLVDVVAEKLGVKNPCQTAETVLPQPVAGQVKLAVEEPMLCECEQVTVQDLERACELPFCRDLHTIRKITRLGLGPCQGTFCIWRAVMLLYENQRISAAECRQLLQEFLAERGKGSCFTLWGDQLKQYELARGIYLNNFQLGDAADEI